MTVSLKIKSPSHQNSVPLTFNNGSDVNFQGSKSISTIQETAGYHFYRKILRNSQSHGSKNTKTIRNIFDSDEN